MNKITLQRFALSGVVGITAMTSSILVTRSASAQIANICFENDLATLLAQGSVTCEDKLFDNFVIDPRFTQTQNPGDETFTIQNDRVNGDFGTFLFEYDSPSGLEFVAGTPALELSYDVTIINEQVFDGQVFEAFDLVVAADPFSDIVVTKEIEILNGSQAGTTLELRSERAQSPIIVNAPAMDITSISVTDTLEFGTLDGGIGEITEFENSFVQKDVDVPEPTTILGLLTLGVLGLSLKCKKQSVRIN